MSATALAAASRIRAGEASSARSAQIENSIKSKSFKLASNGARSGAVRIFSYIIRKPALYEALRIAERICLVFWFAFAFGLDHFAGFHRPHAFPCNGPYFFPRTEWPGLLRHEGNHLAESNDSA